MMSAREEAAYIWRATSTLSSETVDRLRPPVAVTTPAPLAPVDRRSRISAWWDRQMDRLWGRRGPGRAVREWEQ